MTKPFVSMKPMRPRSRRWSPEEDALLLAGLERRLPWADIVAPIEGRNVKQARSRWQTLNGSFARQRSARAKARHGRLIESVYAAISIPWLSPAGEALVAALLIPQGCGAEYARSDRRGAPVYAI